MKFPCTSCGACCAQVKGPYVELLKPYGGLRADGSCVHYDWGTKKCMIYDTRPDICRVEKTCPSERSMPEHFAKVEAYCDKVHLAVYGKPRERDKDCTHSEPQIRLQLETVSTCNAACHFCPYPTLTERRGNTMAEPLFRKIVDEAATIYHIGIYSMQGLGEPMLDRQIAERIAYIHSKAPNAKIELFTNGVLANPARLHDLQKAGLDCLVFSLNATTPEQHEQVMKLKGKFDQVVFNINHAIQLGLNVHVHAVEDGVNFTTTDSAAFKARWGDRSKPVGIGNWAGDLPFKYKEFKPNETCYRALSSIYVMYDGRITMCCFDPVGEGAVFGDLNHQTLREVYASEKYVKFREDHATNNADRYDRCRNCSRI